MQSTNGRCRGRTPDSFTVHLRSSPGAEGEDGSAAEGEDGSEGEDDSEGEDGSVVGSEGDAGSEKRTDWNTREYFIVLN